MIRQIKKITAVMLSFVLVCLTFTVTRIQAADVNITDENYISAGSDTYTCTIDGDAFESNTEFNEVRVPAKQTTPEVKRYILDVSGVEATINSLEIGSGSTLVISDGGKVNAPTINADNNARLLLASKANIPDCIGSVYDTVWNDETFQDELVDISDGAWENATFIYNRDEGKWFIEHLQYSFDIIALDIENSSDTQITLAYSLDGGNAYTNIIKDNEVMVEPSEDFGYWSDEFGTGLFYNFESIMPANKNIKIKFVVKGSKEIVDVMHDGMENPFDFVSNSAGVCTFEYNIDTELDTSKFFSFDLGYPNEGDPKAKELIESDIYAYGDLNGDGAINIADVKQGLAAELCVKYFWEEGGMLDGYFGISEPGQVEERLNITNDGTYTAKNASGGNEVLNKYKYEIALGSDHEGNPVEVTGNVYALRSNTDILVYDGRDFYIRDLKTDAVSFNGKTDDDKAICVCSDSWSVENLKINGNGGGNYQNINPEDSDMFTVFLSNEKFVDKYNNYYGSRLENYFDDRDVCTKLRIMKPGKTYIAISKEAGEGEQKDVPGINFDSVDSICETGTDKYTEVFVGDDIIHINPVSSATGLANTEIASVSLAESSQTDGIKLTKITDEDYKLEFKSNYYDEATIEIVYEDGTASNLIIKRQALVISYMYLEDRGPGVNTFDFDSGATVDYDYFAGEQIIIYATYYHPSNYETVSGDNNAALYVTNEDGSVDIIRPLKHTAATNDTVATTDYFIAFTPAKEKLPDGSWGEPLDNISLSPINALVVNGGFDNDTTFSGTQIGNGKGVYWDGTIKWNY